MRERSEESDDNVREDASDGVGRGRGDVGAMKTGAGHGRLGWLPAVRARGTEGVRGVRRTTRDAIDRVEDDRVQRR